MSGNRYSNVCQCVVELFPMKQGKGSSFIESSPFVFQGSECRIRMNYGWESSEGRKLRIHIVANPSLSPNFYATIHLFKGSQFISYPRIQVEDPASCIWSLLMSDIAKQLPDVGKWNINFKFIFQQEAEYDQKDSGHKFVQTSFCMNENQSIERLSEDFGRLLQGDTKYDVELKSGDVVIKAHKSVLGARSNFFKKKLQTIAGDQIELPCIDPDIFQAILWYMYTGKSPDLSYEMARKIYGAGEICHTGYLKEKCVEFFIENLTLENSCETLALADDDYFKERVVNFIIEKEIPFLDEYWKPFCDDHPTLANIVLNKLIRTLAMELLQRRM